MELRDKLKTNFTFQKLIDGYPMGLSYDLFYVELSRQGMSVCMFVFMFCSLVFITDPSIHKSCRPPPDSVLYYISLLYVPSRFGFDVQLTVFDSHPRKASSTEFCNMGY
jgi:hypothetical protein